MLHGQACGLGPLYMYVAYICDGPSLMACGLLALGHNTRPTCPMAVASTWGPHVASWPDGQITAYGLRPYTWPNLKVYGLRPFYWPAANPMQLIRPVAWPLKQKEFVHSFGLWPAFVHSGPAIVHYALMARSGLMAHNGLRPCDAHNVTCGLRLCLGLDLISALFSGHSCAGLRPYKMPRYLA